MKNVVVFGGGHGLSTILKGIKKIEGINLSAIVTVADDGGSTGRIRELYHIPAMGDIRNVLVALSDDESFFSELMDFRFEGEEEQDIVGHSLGNIILTALTQMSGSFISSIETTSKLLNVKGNIIPSSLEPLTLYARMDDDTIVRGEANIPSFTHHIKDIFYDHEAEAYEKAIKAIDEADLIIYGIGSLYTSIIPNTIIKGIREAIARSKAYQVYFGNCMTQPNETFNFDLRDHYDALVRHGGKVDLIVRHNDYIPEEIRARYTAENSIEVLDHGNLPVPVIERELLTFRNDLVRHDPDKIRKTVEELLSDVVHL
ncbi:MAG: uridine diphosphate-N-acetylglucosamine-binding protein YvcK [Erysipelotrichaceae bacterium]|nr:uridine diphosphate-N-acetylglucosamine-binding protein YvcK [Erysipelotrichaceae bacterium]